MQILVIASRKGGSGKTTLAGHLGVQCELAGDGPAALVDLDPQGSLAHWWNAREADTPAFVQSTPARLSRDIERLRGLGFRWLIVDTPPAMTESNAEVIKLADLVLIPSRPSPHDLRSIGATVDLVEHLGTPLRFVLNAATPRARITAEGIAALSQHGPLVPTVVHQRVDFAVSMIDGRAVMELPGVSRSKAEIVSLWRHLSGRLSEMHGPRAMPRVASGARLFAPSSSAAGA